MFTNDKDGWSNHSQDTVCSTLNLLKNLRLQVVLGENHHLLIGHLGKQGRVFMKAETLQPAGDI